MIDTVVQLNGHNSYHATETFWADPFGVEVMAYITVSAAMYATSNQDAADRIAIRFLDANGVNLGETRHSFAIMPLWERQKVTAAVPTGAMLAQVGFLQGAYWWAEAKTEEGEVATPYAVNAAGQLTWISANGIYTGMITANQIILVDATGENLAERLVTINNSILNMRSSINGNTTAITTIEAGQAEFVKLGDLATAGKTTIDGGNITTGTILANRINFDGATGKNVNLSGVIEATQGTKTVRMRNGQYMMFDGTAEVLNITSYVSTGLDPHIVLGSGASNLFISRSKTVGSIYSYFAKFNDTITTLYAPDGREAFWINSTSTGMQSSEGYLIEVGGNSAVVGYPDGRFRNIATVSYGTATPTSLAPNEIYIQI